MHLLVHAVAQHIPALGVADGDQGRGMVEQGLELLLLLAQLRLDQLAEGDVRGGTLKIVDGSVVATDDMHVQ